MKILEILFELEKYKQELKKLKDENELLRALVQTKQEFEVREDEGHFKSNVITAKKCTPSI